MQNTIPPLEGVLEVALYADDLNAAAAFYGGILGLEEITRQDGRHVFFRSASTIVLVFRSEVTRLVAAQGSLPVPLHGTEGAGHVCFATKGANLDAWVARLKRCSVDIEADFFWPNGARSIYVRDPAGNSVEFAEARMWESE